MITEDKIIKIVCIMYEFCIRMCKKLLLEDKEHRHRKCRLSDRYLECEMFTLYFN